MIQSNPTFEFSLALVIGLLFGSFVEYSVHRLMHMGKFLGKRHSKHHHNFGIGVSLWDRLLGTYKATEWRPERPLREYPLSEFVSIRWR